MRLAKVLLADGSVRSAIVLGEEVRLLPADVTFTQILHAPEPKSFLAPWLKSAESRPLTAVQFLAPIDQQEVWAAGVTYKRSEEARKEESSGAARYYAQVYDAPRPELFFKATPHRVVGTNASVRIRQDAHWNVPEPELALVLSPELRLVGFTLGNDMSSRDIEGENPLYLPQAKVYNACCALGPTITFVDDIPNPMQIELSILIERQGQAVFQGSTTLQRFKRSFRELIAWLGRDNSFPNGVILLTGTGIVPPSDFTLQPDDAIHISGTGLGTLTNTVCQG